MPDEVTYNTLIDGCFQWWGSVEAFKLVEEMKGKGVKPNAVTHNIMVKWYYKEGKIEEADCIVAKIVESGFSPDCFTYNTMINGYCKAENLGEAFKMMDEMGRKGLKMDTFTLNTIVHKLCVEKLLKEAYELTVKTTKRGYIIDEVTYGTLIMGYFKNDQTNKAMKLWDEMKEKGIIPSVVTYNTIIRRLCHSLKTDQAVDKLNELLDKGLAPDEAMCNIIIHGFCWEGALEKAFLFYNRMVENSFKPDVITWLCKHGMFEKAFNLFNTWIIKEGKLDEAFDLMTEMEKKKLGPDRYTYTAIISALTHAGRTEEAKKFMSKLLETSPNMISEDTSQILSSGDMDYSEQITNFCTQGKYKEAMKLFQESEQKGVTSSEVQLLKTVITILTSHRDPHSALKLLIQNLTLPTVLAVLSSTQLHRTHSATLLSFFDIFCHSPHPSLSSSPEPLLPGLLVHRHYSSARSLLLNFISSDHPRYSLH
ncbi:hypothetical protein Ahy_B01g056001 isoform A [Arachis hypogaea]|uniref:Pentatricopeptide repeat-containing protein n=1 Tax=Arachis hypogaea TaxID=3818 RepID=A0A445AXS3_ARAHY|nr:hypothetical protein Ahy_B01g056001 isoform A [Arachis hypogaea]